MGAVEIWPVGIPCWHPALKKLPGTLLIGVLFLETQIQIYLSFWGDFWSITCQVFWLKISLPTSPTPFPPSPPPHPPPKKKLLFPALTFSYPNYLACHTRGLGRIPDWIIARERQARQSKNRSNTPSKQVSINCCRNWWGVGGGGMQ